MVTSSDDLPRQADARSSSAIASARQNFRYMINPRDPSTPHPARLQTRAFLRLLRYVGIFIYWKVVRYAKYALVGMALSAIGATAFGSGLAFVLAPPGILASIAVGAIWTAGKYGIRYIGVHQKLGNKVTAHRQQAGLRDGTWQRVQGPHATPW